MINAPKKMTVKTKEWEKALDEDVRMIKKAKRIIEEKTEGIEQKGSLNTL